MTIQLRKHILAIEEQQTEWMAAQRIGATKDGEIPKHSDPEVQKLLDEYTASDQELVKLTEMKMAEAKEAEALAAGVKAKEKADAARGAEVEAKKFAAEVAAQTSRLAEAEAAAEEAAAEEAEAEEKVTTTVSNEPSRTGFVTFTPATTAETAAKGASEAKEALASVTDRWKKAKANARTWSAEAKELAEKVVALVAAVNGLAVDSTRAGAAQAQKLAHEVLLNHLSRHKECFPSNIILELLPETAKRALEEPLTDHARRTIRNLNLASALSALYIISDKTGISVRALAINISDDLIPYVALAFITYHLWAFHTHAVTRKVVMSAWMKEHNIRLEKVKSILDRITKRAKKDDPSAHTDKISTLKERMDLVDNTFAVQISSRSFDFRIPVCLAGLAALGMLGMVIWNTWVPPDGMTILSLSPSRAAALACHWLEWPL